MIYLSLPPGTTSNQQPATSNTKTVRFTQIMQTLLFLLLFFSQSLKAQQSQHLTQNELNIELRNALDRDYEARIVS